LSVYVYMYLAKRISKDPVFIFEKQRIAQRASCFYFFPKTRGREQRNECDSHI